VMFTKMQVLARRWWLTPVVLATWETKIGRITVPDHLWQKSSHDPISPNGWVWWFAFIIPATWKAEIRRTAANPRTGEKKKILTTLSLKVIPNRPWIWKNFKGWWSVKGACLASVRPWVQSPGPSKKKKKPWNFCFVCMFSLHVFSVLKEIS
jgi:hypothetical protein